jgi:hypothetical protein
MLSKTSNRSEVAVQKSADKQYSKNKVKIVIANNSSGSTNVHKAYNRSEKACSTSDILQRQNSTVQ